MVDQAVAVRVVLDLASLVEGTDLVRYGIRFEMLGDDGQFGPPWLSVAGFREPLASLHQLQKTLGEVVAGKARAVQHDSFEDGFCLSIEAVEGERVRVEWWIDLSHASRALRLRSGMKGERQAGVRLHVDRAGLELFRQQVQRALLSLLS